jgi:hypothetical protein
MKIAKNTTPDNNTAAMPAIYFGKELKTGGNATAIKTVRGDFEPVTPSSFKVYPIRHWASPIAGFLFSLLGHLVAVISNVSKSYLPFSAAGALWTPPKEVLPIFPSPGFAFALPKGEILTQTMVDWLTENNFRSIEYAGKTVWMTDFSTRRKYREVLDMVPRLLTTGNVPNRYLNPASMSGYFSLLSVTTAIFSVFHSLSTASAKDAEYDSDDQTVKGWKNLADPDVDLNALVPDENASPAFKKTHSGAATDWELIIENFVRYATGAGGLRIQSSGVMVNTLDTIPAPFINNSGDDISTSGKIFKYHRELALPDTNLIGDVLGRYFLTCLGPDTKSQFENLMDLKSAIGNLRLLPVGSILTHMYKCLEICILAHSGCRPIFSGRTYEGCILLGGPECDLIVNGELVDLDVQEELVHEMNTISSHAAALFSIEAIFMDSGGASGLFATTTSMYELRNLLLPVKFSQSDRDRIHQYAKDLDYTEQPWSISAGTLQRAFTLIRSPALLNETYPIGRFSLFSSDPITVAFSCFGETSCPSWNIPNGKMQTIGPNPPAVVDSGKVKPGTKGVVSDADWVMTIRMTDLLACCEDFRKMAGTMCYRSVPSAEARKRGFRSFSRVQMATFWSEMVDAVGVTNPTGVLAEEGGFKRKATDSGSGISGKGTVSKKRAMGF